MCEESDKLRKQILEVVADLQAQGWSREGILARAFRDFGVELAALIARILNEPEA